jgi:hypothetical protein
MVEEFTLAQQGVARSDIVDELERNLSEPLPDEVSAEELELRRRKRVATENEMSIGQMAALMGMERPDA